MRIKLLSKITILRGLIAFYKYCLSVFIKGTSSSKCHIQAEYTVMVMRGNKNYQLQNIKFNKEIYT